ncbi:MAG: helix-turn-helix domain-containing protein, partial [Pseudomonadota bacterium]
VEEESVAVNSEDNTLLNEHILPLAEVEKRAVNRAIDICDGNIPLAAAKLEVSPSTLYRKKQSWGD